MKYGSDKTHKEEYDSYCNEKLSNPGHVDEAKWEKAKKISMESYGELRYPFIMYMYKEKLGGK